MEIILKTRRDRYSRLSLLCKEAIVSIHQASSRIFFLPYPGNIGALEVCAVKLPVRILDLL